MNSMNYGQMKRSTMDGLLISGAAFLVIVGFVLGRLSLAEQSTFVAQSPNAALSAEVSDAPHLVDPFWLHSREYMIAPESAAAAVTEPLVDAAATQIITGADARTLVFPEALDGQSAADFVGDRRINPELKTLDYAAVAAPEASLYENPELKALDYPQAVGENQLTPEQRLLDYPFAGSAKGSLYDYSGRLVTEEAATAEPIRSISIPVVPFE